jgi:hypothetical protein
MGGAERRPLILWLAARGEPIFPYKAARSAAETVGKKDEI